MWPNLMGPGWEQQFLMAAGLVAASCWVFWMLVCAAARSHEGEPGDGLLRLWHRYEVGDLTRWEFDRAKGTMPGQLAATAVDRSPALGPDRFRQQPRKGGSEMRAIIAVLILGAAIAVNAATAFGAASNTSAASSNSDNRFFIGDGFDNTTCADLPRGQTCK